jgi:hypothetical protein
MQQLVLYVLVKCHLAWLEFQRTTRTSCFIYTLLPPDDGQLASPKHVEV